MKANKFFLFLVIFLSLIALSSCSADDEDLIPQSGIIETDNPPSELYLNSIDYGSFQKVILGLENIKNPIHFGTFQEGYSTHYDAGGNPIHTFFYADLYKVSAKKYYGIYKNFIYTSKSEIFVLISISDLENLKKHINAKGVAFAFVGQYDYSKDFPRVYPTGD